MSGAGEGEDERKLRILLVAYEFPPSPSPQSLRWAYLAGRLASLGHEVHVMAPAIEGSDRENVAKQPGIVVHRVAAGPLRSGLAWIDRRKRHRKPPPGPAPGSTPVSLGVASCAPQLNWKGRARELLQGVASWLMFPDARGEWKRPALRALPGLLDDVVPDVVVSSHEPATTLEVGLVARNMGFRWVADLADPVLTTYTPRHWRRRALRLEAEVMQAADHVLVTNAVAARLLESRHGRTPPLSIIGQGFDDTLQGPACRRAGHGVLELLYAGSFYHFRDPRSLVEAVLETEGTRLNIASANVPGWLRAAARRWPAKLALLGWVPHRQLLALQRRADVLVDIANADSSQVPGKFYEYLGAARPILHLQVQADDPVARILLRSRRGWVCGGERREIAAVLERISGDHRRGCLDAGLDLSSEGVSEWSWTNAARLLEAVLSEVSRRSSVRAPGGREIAGFPLE